jgi:hypothetical protein
VINTVKRKSSNNSDTIIKVVALGILGYIGLKAIPSLSDGVSGGYSGYSGSGTDLSGIPAGFFTETPPVFNITNTPPDSFFSTPSLSDGETKKDVSVTALGETVTPNINLGFTKPRGIDITPNNEPQPFNLSNPSTWVSATPVENNPLKKIAIPISNNPLATGIRFPFLSKYNIWNNDNGKKLGGFLANTVIPFPLNLLVNAPAVAGGCSGGSCPYITDTNVEMIQIETLPSKKEQTLINDNNIDNAQSYLLNLRKSSSSNNFWSSTPVINQVDKNTYIIQNSQNLPKYYDYSKKAMVTDLSSVERTIQNKFATDLARNNCGSAISTNACSGTKKSVNYATTVSSGTRYYENTGTSLTRSDLTLSP